MFNYLKSTVTARRDRIFCWFTPQMTNAGQGQKMGAPPPGPPVWVQGPKDLAHLELLSHMHWQQRAGLQVEQQRFKLVLR